jgi:hypothetical protein
VRRLLALAATTLLLAGCALSRPQMEQRTTEGPLAEDFFTLRIIARTGRSPNFDERRRWDETMDRRIDDYLRRHPESASSAEILTFRFMRQASVGMDKEQILLLLERPLQAAKDAATMQKEAHRFWDELKDEVSEVWTYPMGWNLFFKDDKVIEIVQFLP